MGILALYDKLLAENARLKEEVEEAKQMSVAISAQEQTIIKQLRVKLDTANKQLAGSAWWVSHSVHKSWCGVNYGNNCSCGLGEALRALEDSK